jgi:hypothetical protein
MRYVRTMKLVLRVIGSGLALAGLALIGFAPAKSLHATDGRQDIPGFYREVRGGRLVSIKPLAAPVPDERPVRRMSEDEIQRLEFEVDKARLRVPRLPDRDERELERQVASDRRPVRLQIKQQPTEQEKNRSRLRLIHRPAPEQGPDEVEVIH